jgi:hypothetical protein
MPKSLPPTTPIPSPPESDVKGAPAKPLPPGPDVEPGSIQEEAETEEAERHEDWGKR